ncbi:hypothetical protein [Deinococcus phoenicis]|uniref:hypothetical protein n=1 Tax=Deinococcus phoenicis TaxID=1476583 RepID=UPI0012695854|nr:hypothetical protein [Deinococcus phoenicis]
MWKALAALGSTCLVCSTILLAADKVARAVIASAYKFSDTGSATQAFLRDLTGGPPVAYLLLLVGLGALVGARSSSPR